MPMLHNGVHVKLKCTQMTLDIIMLQNIFLLHTKLQLPSQISQRIILNTNTWIFSLQEVTYVDQKYHVDN